MCVRSHTKAVQDIIAEVCVYDGCRYWCNTLNPGSMLEFVTPAFTQGIQPHIEQLLGAAAETAIIAALFMTMFVVGYLGGYAPPDSKYINNRGLYSWGFCLGSACFVINLLTSMVFRFCAATMACTVVVLSFCPPVDVAGRCEAGRSGDGAETETGRRQDGDEEQRRAFGLPSLLLKLEIL